MIIETRVWCIEDIKKEEMGLDGGDEWYPIVFDMRDVSFIKLSGSHEFIGNDKAVLILHGNHLVVELSYKAAKALFIESRKQLSLDQ